MSVHAIFENGVFRPLSPVTLPDRCEVEFEPKVIPRQIPDPSEAGLDCIYAAMSESFDTGIPDLAARHDEHQP